MTRIIRIATALIDDDRGRLLLVRKVGTRWFMQAGGKVEDGENSLDALRRELREELHLSLDDVPVRHLGRYSAAAANESDTVVDADIYYFRWTNLPVVTAAEIEEVIWVEPAEGVSLPLAPLTRDHVLPLSRTVRSFPNGTEG